MTVVTLLEKAYGSFSGKSFETMLSSLCKDLRVKIKAQGKTTRGWVQIEISGEDEPVALRLIDREIGLAPVSAERIAKFSVLRGMIIDSARSTDALRVDVGVLSPKEQCAFIPLGRLQAQLADGKNVPLDTLAGLFGLYNFMPVYVKVLRELDNEKELWEADLSEGQVSLFHDWLESNLDRLIVLGANRGEVEEVIERTKHTRDVIRVEALGPLEHAVVCKLGTDAVGLLPKLGPLLRSAFLAPFSPRKIQEEVRL